MSPATGILDRVYWRIPHSVRRFVFRCVYRRSFEARQRLRSMITEDGYTLRSFDELRCIFVHIPKCAGVSVARTLFGNLGGGHLTVRKYQMIFDSREFSEYFKFTFVRNPWDRLVSGYFFLKRGGVNEVDRRWAVEHLSPYPTFDSFVRDWLRPENLRESWHFDEQHRHLCGLPGDVLVDFVGFYENLEDDFRTVSARLGLGSLSLRHYNASELRRSDHRRHYSDETAQIVADVYAEDIRLFGYKFDNSSLDAQLAKREDGARQKALHR